MRYGNDVGFYIQLVIETEDNKKYTVRNYTFDYNFDDELEEYEIMDESIESIEELYKNTVKSIYKGYIYFLNKKVKKVIFQRGVTTDYNDNLYNEFEYLYSDYESDINEKNVEILGKPYDENDNVYLYNLTKEIVFNAEKEKEITRYSFKDDAMIVAKSIDITTLPNYKNGILTFDIDMNFDYSIYDNTNSIEKFISDEYDRINSMQPEQIIELANEELENSLFFLDTFSKALGKNDELSIPMIALSIHKYRCSNEQLSENEKIFLNELFPNIDFLAYFEYIEKIGIEFLNTFKSFLYMKEMVNLDLWFDPVESLFRLNVAFMCYVREQEKDAVYKMTELLELSSKYSTDDSNIINKNDSYDKDEHDVEEYDEDDICSDDNIYNEPYWSSICSRGIKEFDGENQNIINEIVLTIKGIENIINNVNQLKEPEIMNAIMSVQKNKKRAEYYLNLDYKNYYDSRIALIMKAYKKDYVRTLNSNSKDKADYIYNNYLSKHKSLLFLYAASQNMYELDSIELKKIYDSNNKPVEIARINPWESNIFIYKMNKQSLEDFVKLIPTIYAEAEYKNNSIVFTNDSNEKHKIIIVKDTGDCGNIIYDAIRNKLHFEMLGIHNPAPDLYYVLVEISVKGPNDSRRIVLDSNEVTPIPVLKTIAKRFININDNLLEEILKPAFELKGNSSSLFDNDKTDSKSLVYDDYVIPKVFPKDINEIISIFDNENNNKVKKYINKIVKNVKKEINNEEFYNKALINDLNATSKENILKSIATFEVLGDYNDSIILKEKYYNYINDLSKYEYAISIIKTEPKLALNLFESNPTFKDSENYINSIKLNIDNENKYILYANINLEIAETSELEKAIEELNSIIDYKKSKNIINKYINELTKIERYEEAGKLFNAHDYESAYKIYEELGNYKNSKKLLEECNINIDSQKFYKKALKFIKNNEFNEALNILYKISYYKDSFDLINDIIDKVKGV